MNIETHEVEVNGFRTHYVAVGSGPPLLLLQGDGESASVWQWVLPALGRTHRVYAPDLPGAGRTDKPLPSYYAPLLSGSGEKTGNSVASYTSEYYAGWLTGFMDALGLEQAVLVGSSWGGLVALRFALGAPERVTELVLVASSGLGPEVNPMLRLPTIPGFGELMTAFTLTPPGSMQRIWARTALAFADPRRVPLEWVRYQSRIALMPRFLLATVAVLRASLDLAGQRPEEIVLDRLPELPMRTLVVWGAQDRVLPVEQGRRAVERLQRGQLIVIPECGHLPQVEWPERFAATLNAFLTG
jgi:pimeloyl-ACP methyl ester carboxylesterase